LSSIILLILFQITRDILRKKDENGNYVVDYILDKAGQKGTGKWTCMNGLELGSPVTLVCVFRIDD
jgi:6-phosphogluconate dehydrogenase